jgi:NDP-sugar pyrophosphorylase family protein
MRIAIILVGGLGTRLRPIVSAVPKPMAPVREEPFLAILLRRLIEKGFSEAVLAVGYKKEEIVSYFGGEYRGFG